MQGFSIRELFDNFVIMIMRYKIPKNPLNNADIDRYRYTRPIQKPKPIYAIRYAFFAIEFFGKSGLNHKNTIYRYVL